MRYPLFALAPLAALSLTAAPLTAQISARVLIDIPIFGNHRGPVVVDRRDAPRYIVVNNYSSRKHGKWKKDYRHWQPITLYVLDGRYYERSYRNARPVAVYHYRDQYFFEPREQDFYRMRDRDRYDRNDHYDRNGRYDKKGRSNQNGRYDQYSRSDQGGRDDRANRGAQGNRPDPRYDNRARRRN